MREKKKRNEIEKMFRDPVEWVMGDAVEFMANVLMKYKSDPIGLKYDPHWSWLYEPFQRYKDGEISLEKAREKLLALAGAVCRKIAEETAWQWIEIYFEAQTGRSNFWETWKAMEEGDKEAALEIVRVFKQPFQVNPTIQAMKKAAAESGDYEFLQRLGEAYREVEIDSKGRVDFFDKKKKKRWFLWARVSEDFIRSHSFEETLELAEKELALDLMKDDPGNFKKYLHRLGIKKAKKGRPRKPEIAPAKPSLSDLHKGYGREIDEIESCLYRKDWARYLFGFDAVA